MPITKVLIANRGEIAVRIARACRDAGLGSVAVYADPDRDAVHVHAADEAYALGGSTPGDTYLVVDKLLDVARALRRGRRPPRLRVPRRERGLRPGGHRRRADLDRPAAARRSTGSATRSRRGTSRRRPGRRWCRAPRTRSAAPTRSSPSPSEHGLPVAIKAAYGGGGRGLKVARTLEEIPELYDSAVREAVAAFGRGECFVERFLDHPRHVETQCLADMHGNVVVVSTRDCSLQRRNQKLVEEAPAPFLTDAQDAELYRASKAILREAGYVGAGTCEFLVGPDGTISFLEVNTRLQVEHCVSEEVSGIDLVREQFRIAAASRSATTTPSCAGTRSSSGSTARTPAATSCPQPGTVAVWQPPTGPGVRLDSGVVEGSVIGGAFDSMLAKLVVTGRTRQQAIERARRALAEFVVEGMPTVLPFHRAVVSDPAFAPADPEQPFTVHTRWIETEFVNTIPAVRAARRPTPPRSRRAREGRRRGRRQAARGVPARRVRRRGRLRRRCPGGAQGPEALRRRQGRRRGLGRRAHLPDAGHDRQDRRRGGPDRRRRRPGRRPRGDEDGAAAHGAQGRHRDRAAAAVGQTVSSGAVICELKDAEPPPPTRP